MAAAEEKAQGPNRKLISNTGTSQIYNITYSTGERFIAKAAPRNKNINKFIHHEINVYNDLLTYDDHDQYIMPIYSLSKNEDPYYIGYIHFYYLEGHDLYTELEREDLTLAEKCSYFQQMIHALLWLGDKGYTHNDIKENNFFVEYPSKKIRLIDFGFTKHFLSRYDVDTKEMWIKEDVRKVVGMIVKKIPSFERASKELMTEIQMKDLIINYADKQIISKAQKEIEKKAYEEIKNKIEEKYLKDFLKYFYEKILHKLQSICPDLSPGGAAGSPGGAAGGLGGAAAATAGGGRRRRKARKSRKAIKRQRKHRATRNAQRKNA